LVAANAARQVEKRERLAKEAAQQATETERRAKELAEARVRELEEELRARG
jgi:hypothetical protein